MRLSAIYETLNTVQAESSGLHKYEIKNNDN